jgi:hypothetical protein
MIVDNVKDGDSWTPVVCLNYKEALVLQKLLPKELAKSQKRRDHYSDIQESGEASSLQQTMLVLSEEYNDMLINMSKTLNGYIYDERRKIERGEL